MEQKTMKFALSIKLQLLFNFIINIMLKLVIYINGLLLAYKQQWGLASTSRAWATENKYPISFRIATFAISLIPRNPAENSIYTEQVGIKLCTKTGFYGGLQITCDTDNLFYIAIGI